MKQKIVENFPDSLRFFTDMTPMDSIIIMNPNTRSIKFSFGILKFKLKITEDFKSNRVNADDIQRG